MPFSFLFYLQPTYTFVLPNKKGKYAFPIPDKLPESVKLQIKTNKNYKSELARQYDISWQALHKGYLGDTEKYTNFKKLPIQDEYTFVRTYFNVIWSFYVLLIRLLTFKNPFHEISAWWKSRIAVRSNYLKEPITYSEWKNFNDGFIIDKPLVSVIIPTLNRYKYLKDVLKDLEKQDYKNFELIVVDQSEPFEETFYDQFSLQLHVIHQKEKALWLARNTAIEKAKSDFLLLFDDDSRINKYWISNHLKCLSFFDADISSGVSISTIGAEVPLHYSFFKISSQLDTGNVLIKREVFRKLGLFDRQFEKQRMGDGEFGLRAYLEGYLNISNPYADRLHLKVATGGLRQMGSWDAFRPKNIFAPRPVPSVLYFLRRYFGKKRSLFALLKTVPPSIMPYRFKKNKSMMVLGSFISVVLFPVILIQVIRSWSLASKKIKEGSIIKKLDS